MWPTTSVAARCKRLPTSTCSVRRRIAWLGHYRCHRLEAVAQDAAHGALHRGPQAEEDEGVRRSPPEVSKRRRIDLLWFGSLTGLRQHVLEIGIAEILQLQ